MATKQNDISFKISGEYTGQKAFGEAEENVKKLADSNEKAQQKMADAAEKARKKLADAAEKEQKKQADAEEKARHKFSENASKMAGKIGAVGSSVSQLSFVLGSMTGKVGQAVGALGAFAQAFAQGGVIGAGIAAASIGVSALVGHFQDLDRAAAEAAKKINDELDKSLENIGNTAKTAMQNLADFGRSSSELTINAQEANYKAAQEARIEVQKIIGDVEKSSFTEMEINARINKLMLENYKLLGFQQKKQSEIVDLAKEQLIAEAGRGDEQKKNIERLAAAREAESKSMKGVAAAYELGDKVEKLAIKTHKNTKASIDAVVASTQELHNLLSVFPAVQFGDMWQDAKLKLDEYNASLDRGARSLIDRAKLDPAFAKSLAPAQAADASTGGLAGREFLGQAFGTEVGEMFGVDSASALGGELTNLGGAIGTGIGVEGAIGSTAAAAATVAAPAAAAALVVALVTAMESPFLAAGAVAGKVFTDGIMAPIMSLPDKIMEAITSDDAVAMIRKFFDDTIENFTKMGDNIDAVLTVVVAQFPELLTSAAQSFLKVLVSSLKAAPFFINSLVEGFISVFNEVVAALPDILSAAMPALVQALVIGLALTVGSSVLFVPVARSLIVGLTGAILDYFNSGKGGSMFAAIGMVIADMLAFGLGAVVEPVNDMIRGFNDVFKLHIGLLPKPQRVQYGVAGVSGSGGYGGGGSGGGGSGPTNPHRNDIPSFHAGGYITAHSGLFVRSRKPGEVPIMAQTGEGVLNRRATAAVGGEAGINAMNAGGGGGSSIQIVSFSREDLKRMVREVLLPELGNLRSINYVTADGFEVD